MPTTTPPESSRHDAGAFAGGLVSKIAPSAVQLVLLVLVAREGTSEDVGKLAVASAAAFLCGSLAEGGAMTSLSLPQAYYGVDAPPLLATRRARLALAAGGSLLYGLLWACGLGSHDPAFLIALPLPLLLALSYGYAGAMNAGGALGREGAISLVESVLVVGGALVLFQGTSPLAAALVALTAARAVGTVARARVLHRLPQSTVAHLPNVLRRQVEFLGSSSVLVVQGSLDVIVLGFLDTYDLAGVYATLLRTAYAAFLVAEGLTLALYSTRERPDAPRALRHWRATGIALGIASGAVFAVLAHPFLEFVLDRTLDDLWAPILLFAALIPVRFAGYVLSVDIVRAGLQAARIPVLLLGTAIVGLGGVLAAHYASLTWPAALRLASEATITAGFFLIWLRLSTSNVPPTATEVAPRN
jgi:O-antigen/teichoic acid export membrane protein